MNSTLRGLLVVTLELSLAACSQLPSGSPPSAEVTGTALPEVATPTPGPTPTETPVPIARVSGGDQALFEGDMDTAIQEYKAAAANTTDPEIQAAALWGLARSQYTDGRYDDAVATLQKLETDFPASAYEAPAKFLEGESLFAKQQYTQAAAAYQAYLDQRPAVIDSYVSELRGDALAQAGDYQGALDAYTAAKAAPHLDDAHVLDVKMAQMTDQLGNTDQAIAMYDDISKNTTNDYVHAQMDYLAGEAYLSGKKTDQAYQSFRHAVENYPLSHYAYLSLVELVGANESVSDLYRGLTDYYAGVPDKALQALDRYIADHPADDGTAHYYRALCLDDLQKYQDAVDALTQYIQDYPTHSEWDNGWDQKATIQWFNLNLYPDGAQTMLDYVKAAPTSAHAPEALMTAARIYERDGRFDEASATWTRVGEEYPQYDQASTAMVFAGLMQFRQSDFAAALPLFQKSLTLAGGPEDEARAYLWIGKTQQKLDNSTETQNAWQLAQSADPGGYYSDRAADLLMSQAPFAAPLTSNLKFDLAADRPAADSWMRLTFKLAPDTDLSGLGELEADSRLIRGREFWNLGLYDEARLEFEDLRTSISSDPVLTYRLANYLLGLGLYRSAITAARQVLTLAGMVDQASTMLAPAYFTHLRYGLYFSDLIVPAAGQNGIDPLLLFSVVRQESLFEGFVSSTAGARGLMQIVPATGADIARALGWPINYTEDMLYWPKVSVDFGAYYLASNRKTLGGDMFAALAAYNGGPANAGDSKRLAADDPDAFLESVRAQETRDYIRSIYEIYAVYRHLYGPGT
jgi:soluble lytic murein transglycosylase